MGYFKVKNIKNKTKFKWQKLCLDSNYRTLDSPPGIYPKEVLSHVAPPPKNTQKPSDNKKGTKSHTLLKNGVDYICCEGVCPWHNN